MDAIDGPLDSLAVRIPDVGEDTSLSSSQDTKESSITSSTDSVSSGDAGHQAQFNATHGTDSRPAYYSETLMMHAVHPRVDLNGKGFVLPSTHSTPTRSPPPVHTSTWNDEGITCEEMPFDQHNAIAAPLSYAPDNDIPAPSPSFTYSGSEYYSSNTFSKPNGAYFSETDDSLPILAPPETKRLTESPSSRHRLRSPETLSFPMDESPVKRNRESSNAKAVLAKWKEEPGHDESFHASDCEPQFEPPSRLPPPILRKKENYEEFGLSPGSVTEEGSKSRASEMAQRVAEKEKRLVSLLKSTHPHVHPSDDDDSLFDFGDEETKRLSTLLPAPAVRTSPSRRSRRSKRQPKKQEDSDADTSLDADYGVVRQRSSSLQERAQQAFKTRNPRVKERSHSNPKQRQPTSPHCVKFDQNKVVYHFPRDEHHDIATLGGTGATLEYLKSIESEVEDAIKDLLFIGSGKSSKPGRKKVKPTSEVTREVLSVFGDDSTINDSVTLNTVNTMDDSSLYGMSFVENKLTTEPKEGAAMDGIPSVETKTEQHNNDPLMAMWGLVEGTMQAMGAILETIAKPEEKELPNEDKNARERGIEANCISNNATPSDPVMTLPTHECVTHSESKGSLGIFESVTQSASDYFSKGSLGTSNPTESITPEIPPASTEAHRPKSTPDGESITLLALVRSLSTDCGSALEEDIRLSEFALHTARSVHQLNRVEFDEVSNPNVITQMEFVYVTLSLPLGILFQENSGGCWVAKVFSGGNASRGNVKVGDQLGAIDGHNAIEMTVDDICKAVSEVTNPNSIDLTLLRYCGPLLPKVQPKAQPKAATLHDEGLEMQVPEVVEEQIDIIRILSLTAPEPITMPPPYDESKLQQSPEKKKNNAKEGKLDQNPEAAGDISQKRGWLFSRKKKEYK